MKVNIGLNDADRKKVAKGLSDFLADTYLLYAKSQVFHWNVTGMHFHSLHLLFESHYTELAMAIDVIAERIRALGLMVPGGLTAYQKNAKIEESKSEMPAKDMVKILVKDHEICISRAHDVLKLAEKADDQPTIELMTERMQFHEKSAWMLRSLLEE